MALHNASASVGSALPKLDCNAMDACMDYVHSMRVLAQGLPRGSQWMGHGNADRARVATATAAA